MVINPPFQAPDETFHLYKIYGITQGSLNFKKYTTDNISGAPLGKKLTFSGQYLPHGLVKASRYNERITFKPELKTSFVETKKISKIPLEKNNIIFVGFPNAPYTPVSYMPALFVIWVLSLLNASPFLMLYAGRLCSLAVYLLFSYFAIKITPIRKWLFLTLALMPMVVYEASALSVDAVTNGSAFLLVGYCLYLAYGENVRFIEKKHNIIFMILTLLLSVTKFAYLPLIFLYLLIPKEKFQNVKSKYLNFSLILLLNTIITTVIVGVVIHLSESVESFSSNLDKGFLIKNALLHPVDYLILIIKTLVLEYKSFVSEIIGIFGWSDTNLPAYCVKSYLFLLFLVSIAGFKEKLVLINKKSKALFVFIGLVSFLLVVTACYLIFEPNDISHTIMGVQGRYLIPFLPVILLIFYNDKINFKTNLFKYIVLFIINFILFVSFIRIIARFYI